MEIAEIFYLTATIVLVLVGVVTVYIAYQVYKLTLMVKLATRKTKRVVSGLSAAKYTMQAAFFKTIIDLLGGRGGEKNGE